MAQLGPQLEGYRLTTAEIIYRLPDHPSLLQSYIWQEYDHIPDFPVLHLFLDFWEKSLDGKLYRVRVVQVHEIHGGLVTVATGHFQIH